MYCKQVLLLVFIVQLCFAPPVTKEKKVEANEEVTDGLQDYIEYHRYIREVVNALESDPTFREKLETANEADIKSGKIAHELELVSHHVRTRLDEIKRAELQRLKELVAKKSELNGENTVEDPTHLHIDHSNPHTFEIEDLKKLIAKTTEDLAEADKKRREEFKQYELEKEYQKFEKLNHTSGEERKKLEEEYKQMEDKHKKHDKLHTPGHKQQLEEVWQEQDHMEQDFDPKTFFMLHDLDSNGLWDQDEVKALFVKELDKMYAASAPEDDLRERVEEMERMRESVFKEMDYNNDGFIDYNEFLHQTKKNDFDKDPGWKGLDEQRPFTDQELEEYIQHHQMQYPPHPGYHPNDINAQMYPQQGYHPQGGYAPQGHPPQMQYPPQGGHMPQQGHPGQGGQHPQGYASAGGHPGQGSQYAHGPPGQGPPYHPQQQLHPGQLPQAQVHPQQIPSNAAGQHPQQGQLHSQQIHNQAAPNAGHNLQDNALPPLNRNEVHGNVPNNVQQSHEQINHHPNLNGQVVQNHPQQLPNQNMPNANPQQINEQLHGKVSQGSVTS